MTKSEMAFYRRRRLKIIGLLRQHIPQWRIATMLKMTPQRVNQIARATKRDGGKA